MKNELLQYILQTQCQYKFDDDREKWLLMQEKNDILYALASFINTCICFTLRNKTLTPHQINKCSRRTPLIFTEFETHFGNRHAKIESALHYALF